MTPERAGACAGNVYQHRIGFSDCGLSCIRDGDEEIVSFEPGAILEQSYEALRRTVGGEYDTRGA
jgi:hypothetical protein